MDDQRAGRLSLGILLGVISAGFILSIIVASKVALSEANQPPEPKRLASVTTPLTPPPGTGLTAHDLDQLFQEERIAVVGPAGSTPEELIETILQDPTLPRRIRDPFVALVKAKAPHLLAGANRWSDSSQKADTL